MKTTLLALASMFVAALFAACGGGGTTTTVRTIAPSESINVNTGAPELDAVARAALTKDDIQLAGLAGYSQVGCIVPEKQVGAPVAPPCRDNESDNTVVEVLPVTDECQAGYVRPEHVPDAFRSALGDDPKLLTVYKPKPAPNSFGAGFGAGAIIVFQTGQHDAEHSAGVAFHVKDGRVVWIESDCGNVFQLLTPERVATFMVNPGEAAVTAASTAAADLSTAVPVTPTPEVPADTPEG
jgi:hypothetical protein